MVSTLNLPVVMILYQLLIQLINMNQEQESYEINNEILMNLSDFPNQYFGAEFEVDEKHVPGTQHTQKILKSPEWMNQENQASVSHDENKNETGQKKSHKIEYNLQKLFRIQKSKKGRPKQAKNINQIFKSEILYYLNMLIEFNIFSEQEEFQIKKFKQKTCCVINYLELVKWKIIKDKLIEYYQSPQILRRILTSERLVHSRKIQFIKHYNILSKIIKTNCKSI